MKTISIANDFTKYPGGRYRKHGKGSGEEFREEFLVPALDRREPLTIILDGTAGYSSSFLEEAFGGLTRRGFAKDVLHDLLKIEGRGAFQSYVGMIWQFVDSSKSESMAH
jgi:hypothetical protein